jgi:uncharacterized RDD family membrane protein YckC
MFSLPMPSKSRYFTGPALIWKRIAAFLIDMLMLAFFVFIPFRRVLSGSVNEYSFMASLKAAASNDELVRIFMPYYIAMSLIALLYFYLMEKKMQQTIGKKIMNLYVVSNEKELKRWQIFVRSLFFIPIFPFDLLIILDPLFMIFKSSNQRLSEILSRTKVVGNYKIDRKLAFGED